MSILWREFYFKIEFPSNEHRYKNTSLDTLAFCLFPLHFNCVFFFTFSLSIIPNKFHLFYTFLFKWFFSPSALSSLPVKLTIIIFYCFFLSSCKPLKIGKNKFSLGKVCCQVDFFFGLFSLTDLLISSQTTIPPRQRARWRTLNT